MKRYVISSIMVLILTTLFYGCTINNSPGPTGPVGPAGPAGPEAVNYSFSGTFYPDTTFLAFSLGNTAYELNDAVLVYMEHPNYDEWVQLPWTYHRPGALAAQIWFSLDKSKKVIYVTTTRADNQSGSPWATPIPLYFKAVVVKATPGKAPPKIDYGNYQAVKKYYNLAD
jgi:hypothetical protein